MAWLWQSVRSSIVAVFVKYFVFKITLILLSEFLIMVKHCANLTWLVFQENLLKYFFPHRNCCSKTVIVSVEREISLWPSSRGSGFRSTFSILNFETSLLRDISPVVRQPKKFKPQSHRLHLRSHRYVKLDLSKVSPSHHSWTQKTDPVRRRAPALHRLPLI